MIETTNRTLLLILAFTLAMPAHADNAQVDINKSLDGLKYRVVYPSYMPPGFRIVRAQKEPDTGYQDYIIEFCDGMRRSCCSVSSAHELGDSLLNVNGNTPKKKVKSQVFGEVVLYLASAKENQAWLDEYTEEGKKSPTYKNSVAETDWLQIKSNSEAVFYSFNCYGLSDALATKNRLFEMLTDWISV
jgi:hypothetical protein